MLRATFLTCLFIAATVLPASTVEVHLPHGAVRRDSFWAPTLGVQKRMVVYLPPSYGTAQAANRRYPLTVYLHGRWGDETDWVKLGRLAYAMDSLIATGMPEMIVAMPDGDDGWWTSWASPSDTAACRVTPHRTEPPAEFCVPKPDYDAYVVHDVLQQVDSTYRTLPQMESRAIGGLSMGAYGAFTIAARFPGTFAIATSHSGVLTLGPTPDSTTIASTGRVTWRSGRTMKEIRAAVGENEWSVMYPMFGLDLANWNARDPARLLIGLKARGEPIPMLYADIALEDERIEQNRIFREEMAAHHIPLLYAEWEGKHSWTYFQNHMPEGLHFIADRLARQPSIAHR